MNRLRKLILVLMALAAVSCGTSYDEASAGATSDTGRTLSPVANRFVIRSATIGLEVDDIAEASSKIVMYTSEIDGVVDGRNQYSDASANLQLKIPQSKLDEFVSRMSLYGKVTEKSLSARDVTEEVVDVEARLKNWLALRDRFRALLVKANTVEEILKIESELARIQSEIDSFESRKKSLMGQVALSAVYVTLNKRTVYGPLGYVGRGVWWLIEKLFVID